ncbi:MAG: D-2-hydroxyacid dehydrogenase [Chloroflexi bacterium]|nr:D-2-hydroxyacid dehydrogenase [Chloroflexota bacterium]MYB16983.1 D-2-hydroxyacid dehydrogenase [Chloroflexota bacterium]MYC48223.1 D-2-hydroxyacid dehydrogenase [Chloroflexota bacterium]
MKVLAITNDTTLPGVSQDQINLVREAAGPGSEIVVTADPGQALAEMVKADVLLGQLNPELFAVAERLKWVHATASGVDGYLFEEFKRSAIPLTGEKGLVGPHLADHAFALLLALARSLKPAMQLKGKAWRSRVPMRRAAFELGGLTIGIVGFGGTGRAIADRAAGFGMKVCAVDALDVPGTTLVPVVDRMDRFDSLLGRSDVVAVCTPLTPETHHLFNRESLALMKPGSVIVNVTRGEVVELEAVIDAVESGHLRGAALDVVDGEPLPADHRVFDVENIILTPHTAGASERRAQRNLDRFCENLQRFRSNRELLGLIDKETGF